ncbi:hypothetical protein Bca52824_038050 [Brassica carinata]|uniref:Uncharacterized protein n=1 Tax=Brassica carinata TaxID=52824 RepID=A0A8X7UWT3_BRACI|nr:hypothetical protein Bca52824_038050 [Brassica carinata]
MPGGVPKLPKFQPADIQADVGWGHQICFYHSQPFDWIKKTFIDKPATEEN